MSKRHARPLAGLMMGVSLAAGGCSSASKPTVPTSSMVTEPGSSQPTSAVRDSGAPVVSTTATSPARTGTTAGRVPAGTNPPVTQGTPPMTLPSGELRITGTIGTVDAAGRTFTLVPPVSGYSTVTLNTATRIRLSDSEPGTFADVQPNSSVVVTGTASAPGRFVARIVDITDG